MPNTTTEFDIAEFNFKVKCLRQEWNNNIGMRHKRMMSDGVFRYRQKSVTAREKALAVELANSNQSWRLLSRTIYFQSSKNSNNYMFDDVVSKEFPNSTMPDSESGQGFIYVNANMVDSVVAFLKEHGARKVSTSANSSDLCYIDDENITEPKCKKCGTSMLRGKCQDATCPFSDRYQWESFTEG